MLTYYFLPYALMVLFFAFVGSTLTLFLHFCLGFGNRGVVPGRIFSNLGVWLIDKYENVEANISETGTNFWKAFTCVVCFNFYVNLFVFVAILFGGFFEDVRWYWILVWFLSQTSISSFFTRKSNLQ